MRTLSMAVGAFSSHTEWLAIASLAKCFSLAECWGWGPFCGSFHESAIFFTDPYSLHYILTAGRVADCAVAEVQHREGELAVIASAPDGMGSDSQHRR